MKFRKLLLCMITGIVLTGFAKVYTYAAEDNIVTEDTKVQDTTVNASTDGQAVADNGTVSDTTNTDSSVTDGESTDAVLGDTTGTSSEEGNDSAAEAAEAKKAAEEKAAKEAAEKKAAAEKAAAKKKAAKEAAAKKAAKEKAAYSKADLRLLSALIYCEANSESYNGKLAVGIVVMNRKRSGAYPDTIKGVIYQKYQFGPATNGALSKALKRYDQGKFTSAAQKACIKAAKAALSGTTTITVNGSKKNFSKYLYFSGSLKGNTLSLGNHEFK